jgi:hypothetical protein
MRFRQLEILMFWHFFNILAIYPTENGEGSENALKAAFRVNPAAWGNFEPLIDRQYVKFLQNSTDDEKLLDNGRLMMAVTTHIHLLYSFTTENIRKRNPLVM